MAYTKLWPKISKGGEIDLSECYIDATFVIAKKGACVGKTKRGKGTKLMRFQRALLFL